MKKQIAIREDGQVPAVIPIQSESAAIISMIERAARDPAVDVDKMHRLLEMHSQITARSLEREYDEAMNRVQAEMEPVRKDCNNSQTRSTYASLAALDGALRPIYIQHGFSLSFNTLPSQHPAEVIVEARVARSGFSRLYSIPMPADGKGAKGNDVMTRTHATGSAVTYGRRYLLGMIFNIVVTDDDDGNAAARSGEKIGKQQIAEIQKLIVETASDIDLFCKHMKVEKIADIPASGFNAAIGALKAKRDRK